MVEALPTSTAAARDALVATKLHRPRLPPGLVPRPRLAQRLDQGIEQRLVLVCTPAGFGKTTLVASMPKYGTTRSPIDPKWRNSEGAGRRGRGTPSYGSVA